MEEPQVRGWVGGLRREGKEGRGEERVHKGRSRFPPNIRSLEKEK